jgi:uncharacterized Fe-S radical SAM superfamily protein PflX
MLDTDTKSVGVKKKDLDTYLNYSTHIVHVSYECRTPTLVKHLDMPNHIDVCSS